MPKQDAAPEPAEVLYPTLTVNGIEIPAESFKVTAEQMKHWLGWETEEEFLARMAALPENKDVKPEKLKKACEFKSLADCKAGERPYLLIDAEGNKVKCHHNSSNREFKAAVADKYCQDILDRNWSGPSVMPGETVNGDTIVISRTGQCLSIQHRGVGLILAVQKWKANPTKYPGWTEEPFLETLFVEGVSDSNRVIQTIDNGASRTEADVLMSSGAFDNLAPADRRECVRMLAKCMDFLWRRTGAGLLFGGGTVAKTHSEEMSFRARHPKVDECVRFIFGENSKRALSNMMLSPGECAAMMYLMGSCESDVDAYRPAEPRPSEKQLKWSMWKRAKEFWAWVSKAPKLLHEDREDGPARGALADVANRGSVAKAAVLAKAWKVFKDGGTPKSADLVLDWLISDKTGAEIPNPEWDGFGGIDVGVGRAESPEQVPGEEEVEQSKEEVRKEALTKAQQKIAELRAKKEAAAASKKPAAVAHFEASNGEAHGGKAVGEVAKPEPVKHDKDGKPPAPSILPKPLHKAEPKKAPRIIKRKSK